MKDTITIQELQEAIQTPRVTAMRKLQALGCPFEVRTTGKGRPKKHYLMSGLPDEWQLEVNLFRRKRMVSESVLPTSSCLLPVPANGNGNGSKQPALVAGSARPSWEGLSREQQNLALAKSQLVALYREHSARAKGWGDKGRVKESFLRAYNLADLGSFPDLFKQVGPVSFQSIEAWHLRLLRNKNDAFVLADRRGKHRKGLRQVDSEQAAILRNLALSPNKPLKSEVIRSALARFEMSGIECHCSEATLRRWLNDFKREHYAQWVLFREGEKALNEKCLPHIQRDIELIEVGDVVIADGHVLNWQILNPWTGRPQRMSFIPWYDMRSNYVLGWEIMPSENVNAITSAMYRGCLCLGKLPKVAYLDNGRAFRAQFFTGVKDFRQEAFTGAFRRLGMQVIYAWAYHGESKTIERFFGTFAELERSAPAYIGTSIENKPARLRRNEKLHKALHGHLTGGRVPTIEESHRAIAAWLDEYHARPQAGHLKGSCPREIFEAGRGPGFTPEQMHELRFLMMSQEIKKIARDGIKFPWCEERYYHPELFGRQQQSAMVRYDWQDKSRVWVYDLDGNFICDAERMRKIHPAAKQLGSEADVAELQSQIEMKRSLAKQTMGPARKFLEEHIMPEVRRQLEDSGFATADPDEKPTSGAIGGRACERPMSEEEKARLESEFEALQALHAAEKQAGRVVDVEFEELVAPDVVREPTIWDKLATMTDMDRYTALLELAAKGEEIPPQELTVMSLYEKTEEFARYRDFFEEHRVKLAMLYQGD